LIPFNRVEKAIPDLTAMVVLITTIASFALSFCNLQEAALQAGINPWLAWMWPLCIDAVLIGGSLMILRSSLKKESSLVGWAVLLSFTCISTAFNVLHSPEDIVSRSAHAIPPIALCVSVELLMIIIRSDLRTTSPVTDIEQPAPLPDRATEQVVAIPEINDQPYDQARSEIIQEKISVTISDEDLIEIFRNDPGLTVSAASRFTGVPRGTLQRKVTKLRKEGKIPSSDIPVYLGLKETSSRTTGPVEAVQ
jgi:hypothetical protein